MGLEWKRFIFNCLVWATVFIFCFVFFKFVTASMCYFCSFLKKYSEISFSSPYIPVSSCNKPPVDCDLTKQRAEEGGQVSRNRTGI